MGARDRRFKSCHPDAVRWGCPPPLAPVARLVEQRTFNAMGAGSIPVGGTLDD